MYFFLFINYNIIAYDLHYKKKVRNCALHEIKGKGPDHRAYTPNVGRPKGNTLGQTDKGREKVEPKHVGSKITTGCNPGKNKTIANR